MHRIELWKLMIWGTLAIMFSHGVQGYLQGQKKPEVFVFLLETNSSVWSRLDWTKVTTIVLAGWSDSALIEYAKKKSVVVSYIPVQLDKESILNATLRSQWVKDQINYTLVSGFDGINFDFEYVMLRDSEESKAYTELVKETADAFRKHLNYSQISIDFGWTPDADLRQYEYRKLAEIVDLVFIMGYDTQSQMWEKDICKARPNSPLLDVFNGVRRFMQLGVSSKKIVMGVPWYGYKYPCESFSNGECKIREVPFLNCNCSDAAGVEITYQKIVDILKETSSQRKWDSLSKTPYFDYEINGTHYQIWYDDPSSLSIKYQISVGMGLRGVGFWTGNFLDYQNSTMVQSMWSILP